MPAKSLSAGSIWKTLSSINVNKFTEEKGGLTYLSWSHAYRLMMENYPEMTIKWHGTTDSEGVTRDVTYYEGGTATVSCTGRVGDVAREMWLPVMDYRMKSIEHPSSRDISDAKMRCMVKAFSLFGLANYLYSGDGLPHEEAKGVTNYPAQSPPKKSTKAKAKPEPKLTEPTKENADAVYVSELQAQLKKLAHELHDTGEWEPDDDTKTMIKSAMKSDDISLVKETLEKLTLLAKAAGQLTSDKELF